MATKRNPELWQSLGVNTPQLQSATQLLVTPENAGCHCSQVQRQKQQQYSRSTVRKIHSGSAIYVATGDIHRIIRILNSNSAPAAPSGSRFPVPASPDPPTADGQCEHHSQRVLCIASCQFIHESSTLAVLAKLQYQLQLSVEYLLEDSSNICMHGFIVGISFMYFLW